MDYVEKLSNIFNKLDNHIAFLCPSKSGWVYRQKGKSLAVGDLFFDLPGTSFIKYTTIIKNKEVLEKLDEYKNREDLICFHKIPEGFEVKVYNRYGELIYKQYIKFFDKIGWLLKWRLKSKYPELVLSE